MSVLLKPGDVSPNVKVIDADMLEPFRNGSALIKKGQSYALINSSGRFIVPFNTYTRIEVDNNNELKEIPWMAGIYKVYNEKLMGNEFGFINFEGKILIRLSLNGLGDINYGKGDDEFMNLVLNSWPNGKLQQKEISINSNGDIIQFPLGGNAAWNEGIATYQDNHGTNKYGFKNRKGQKIIQPQFDAASVFSEGLAAVGKKNEFGELKWGYINEVGKMVIPPTYSIQPGDFLEDMAVVIPRIVEDFKYAFINKEGKQIIKVPVNTPLSLNQYVSTGRIKNESGYIFVRLGGFSTNNYFLDSGGNVLSIDDLLQNFNINGKNISVNPTLFYDGIMAYMDNKKVGFLDFTDSKYIPAVFESISVFDKKAHLAYAKFFLRRDKLNNKDVFREGYIDKYGIFRIIKGETSKF